MPDPKPPAPRPERSPTDLAASLERDKDASLVGEFDLGLDDDPDLRTRPGMKSLSTRPPRRRSIARTIGLVMVVILLAATGGWLFGLLDGLGVPPPPEAVTSLLRGGESADAEPTGRPHKTKKRKKASRR